MHTEVMIARPNISLLFSVLIKEKKTITCVSDTSNLKPNKYEFSSIADDTLILEWKR